jgi:2-polyprenyl-6-hydroxyphenyl methylase/3-demethylubiquinone-9 3-methyltransferase
VDTPPGAKVLDLGCGNGSLIATFRGRGWELYGLDISRSGIEQAKKHFENVEFFTGDATGDLTTVFRPAQFDVIISTEVIEHVYNPRGLLRNCFQLLKPGGVLVISTPYHGYLKNLALGLTGRMDSHLNALSDHGHIKFWSRSTLGALLQEAGFENREFAGAGRVPYLWKSMVMRAVKPWPESAGVTH